MGLWKARRTLSAIIVALACVFVTSVSSAISIVVGKDITTNAPAVYKREANGVCSKQVLSVLWEPFGRWGVYRARGTDYADVIVVKDSGSNMSWCGFSIPPLAALPANVTIEVWGNGGADAIWGGSGGGAAKVSDIYATEVGGGNALDTAPKTIWMGPADYFWPAEYATNTVLLPQPVHGNVGGGTKNDVFCTHVTNGFTTYGVNSIYGNAGTDARYGPNANYEESIETSGGTATRDKCDSAYLQAAFLVLALAAEG